ncbi:LeoA/HP0731 family dynamin-like GTPase, partial [Clostridium perfringens]|uniref:LeoA/HP0731 family dynamin-like GTPase n=1 Tax=Clostridium perfringens TaxID=1502 RepID=UPI0039E860A9
MHNIVIKAGHSIGYKFKPWQAIKITKGVAIAGQALAIVGVGLSVFMQIKSDKDEEKIREDLRKNRQNIRSQFNSAASELEDYGREFIRENI